MKTIHLTYNCKKIFDSCEIHSRNVKLNTLGTGGLVRIFATKYSKQQTKCVSHLYSNHSHTNFVDDKDFFANNAMSSDEYTTST